MNDRQRIQVRGTGRLGIGSVGRGQVVGENPWRGDWRDEKR